VPDHELAGAVRGELGRVEGSRLRLRSSMHLFVRETCGFTTSSAANTEVLTRACWCGGTRWREQAAMRISVSSWVTSDEDVDFSLEAILRIAEDAQPRS